MMSTVIFIGGFIIGFLLGCLVMAHAESIFGDTDGD